MLRCRYQALLAIFCVFLFMSGQGCALLPEQEGDTIAVELQYDNGNPTGVAAAYEGFGVLFSNENILEIPEVKICAVRYDGKIEDFEIEIWDEDLQTLYSKSYGYEEIFPVSYPYPNKEDLQWVTLPLDSPVTVTGDFYVGFFGDGEPFGKSAREEFPNTPEGGVAIGNTMNNSGHSCMLEKNPNQIDKWPAISNHWNILQEEIDWMIRVTALAESVNSGDDEEVTAIQTPNDLAKDSTESEEMVEESEEKENSALNSEGTQSTPGFLCISCIFAVFLMIYLKRE
jgi:hypothetical protein